MDSFLDIFKPKSTTPVPQQQPRTYYKRDDDPRVETLRKIKLKVSGCDREIEECDTKLMALDDQITETLKKYRQHTNKKSTQAVALQAKGGRLMAEKQRLLSDRTTFEVQRTTLSSHLSKLTKIVNIEEMNLLTNESTLHIQNAMGNIDLHTAKTSKEDAKRASKTVDRVAEDIMNPFGFDLEESTTAFNDAFANLELGEDEFFSEETIVEKQPAAPISTSAVKRGVQQQQKQPMFMDDEGF